MQYNIIMAFDDPVNTPFASHYPSRPSRPRRRWLERILLAGFLFCLIVGLITLFWLWQLYRGQQPVIQLDNPLASIQTEQVVAGLAIAELAGDPADALAYQAIQAGYLETSRAALLFHHFPNGATQLNLLLLMAQHYSQQDESEIAGLLFHQARAVVLLDGSFSSLERSQALLQISQGLAKIGKLAEAQDAASQTLLAVRRAPDLLPAQRSEIFTSLRPLADQLSDETLRRQLTELVRNPFFAIQENLVQVERIERRALPLDYTDALKTAIGTRQQRARELVNRINFTGGADIGPEQAALQQALLAEDQAWIAFVAEQQQANILPGQQLWLLLAQRDWLLTKLRIASGAFGLALVPEWTANHSAYLRELNAVTGAIDTLLQTIAAAEPDPLAQATFRLAARQWLALQHELGHYPDSSAEQLNERLLAAQNELTQLGSPVAFPIAYDAAAVPSGFRLQAMP